MQKVLTSKEKVYIILLNYNGWQDTIECLESLLNCDYPNYQVIVVDNCSPNNSLEYIIGWANGRQELTYPNGLHLKHLSQPVNKKPVDYILYNKEEALNGGVPEFEESKKYPIILIQTGENQGFAAGNNIGIKYALEKSDFQYIWLLNNDTVLEKDSLSKLVEKEKEYTRIGKKIGIIGSKLLYYDNPKIIQGIGGIYNKQLAVGKHIGIFEEDKGQYDNEEIVKQIDYTIGASMLVKREFLNEVGLMCEDYFLYFEEIDWILRGKKIGWEIGYSWESKVYHKEGSSIGSSPKGEQKSELADYYGSLNRIKFTKKFYPKFMWSVYLGFLIVLLNRLRRGQFSRIGTIFKILLTEK